MFGVEQWTGIILAAFFAVGCIFLIWRLRFFNDGTLPRKLYMFGFIVKLTAGTVLGWVYSSYYTDRAKADTFRYFDDSEVLYSSIYESPKSYLKMVTGFDSESPELQVYYDKMNYWYDSYSPVNDNRAIIRTNSVLRLFSGGHYHIHMVIVCFLAFIGIVASTKALARFHQLYSTPFYLSFIIVPSVVFWGSGLMKDSLGVFALGSTIYSLTNFRSKQDLTIKHIVLWIFCMSILMQTRFQLFLLMCPLSIAWLIAVNVEKKGQALFLATYLSLTIATISAWGILFDKGFIDQLSQKRNAFIELALQEKSKSLFSTQQMETGFPEVLTEPFTGFFNSLTQPSLSSNTSAINTIAGIENVMIVSILIFLTFLSLRNQPREWSLFLTLCMTLSISYLAVTGMVTPVAGALVRYKAALIPYMIIPMLVASGLGLGINKILGRFSLNK
ncbi:MAG: hypothetical protein ACKPAD_10430 [Bacteroidota bacterium]